MTLRSPVLQPIGVAGAEPLPVHDDEARRMIPIERPPRQLACAVDASHAMRGGQCVGNRRDPWVIQIAKEPDRPVGFIHRSPSPPCRAPAVPA